jgi:ATP-dependent helicase YprA (DUF1998 family)
MSENNAAIAWPPLRKQHHHHIVTSISENTTLSHPETPTRSTCGPRVPLSNRVNQKRYRNGFETKPKVPAYRPYALNSPGFSRQQAFANVSPVLIRSEKALDPAQWNMLAINAGIIPDGSDLHDFQIECSNTVMERAGDVILVSPTGSGKSLVWVLPLLARRGGVSLVITPYTSLGLDSEIRCAIIHLHIHIQC